MLYYKGQRGDDRRQASPRLSWRRCFMSERREASDEGIYYRQQYSIAFKKKWCFSALLERAGCSSRGPWNEVWILSRGIGELWRRGVRYAPRYLR